MTLKNVAIVGATGQIGRLILEYMAKRNFPAENFIALASKSSTGKTVTFGKKDLPVQALDDFDFADVSLAIFCVPQDVYTDHIPRAAAAGCMVIDNSNHYRTDPDVPLIVPEINGHRIADSLKKNIICGANCATIQLLMALKPLHDYATIKRIVVSTYHSASGIGFKATEELRANTKASLEGETSEPKAFPRNLAFDVIPQAEVFMQDGATTGEWKMVHDTHKILETEIPLTVTCVRVPVMVGHSEAVNVEFEKPISPEKAKELLSKFPGVCVQEGRDDYATPAQIEGTDDVYVSRIRKDSSVENGLNLWVVADNLRKGAALNTIQVAECWLEFMSQNPETQQFCAQEHPKA